MPPLRWRHIIINTKNSWHHGDPRGFRSRNHRIHSSGDYKNPPPKGEHAGLLHYRKEKCGQPISISKDCHPKIVHAFRDCLIKQGHRVLVIACSAKHLHALTELPEARSVVTEIIGRCKRVACGAVKKLLPGSIWSAKGEFKRMKDRAHQNNTYQYIRDDQGPGTFVWTYKGEEFWIE